MANKFYKPIGEIFKSGSSINGKDAFIKAPGFPLRGSKSDKAVNTKPDKAQVAAKPKDPDLKLRLGTDNLGQGSKGNNVKVKQERLSSQQSTTTPRGSSSTTPGSTSTPVDTSSAKTDKSNKPKTTTPNMARPKDKDNVKKDKGHGSRRGDSPMYTSSTFVGLNDTSNPFNTYTPGSDAAPFVTEGLPDKVKWDYMLESNCILRTDRLDMQSASGDELNPRLFVNVSCFSSAISDSASNAVLFYNDFLKLTFNKFTTDLFRVTKGIIPTYWTLPKVVTALSKACFALEVYYTLDSLISFSNSSVVNLKGSRSAMMVGNKFNDPIILQAKDNLRRSLQGVWFPPEFSMMIRKFYQWYRTSDTASQAPLFRYVPDQAFVSTFSTATLPGNINTLVSGIITSLSDSDNLQIWGILSNMYPNAIINGLPKSCSDAVYDEDMLEVFLNEALICADPNNTNVVSCTPLSYPVTNDIPYVSLKDPKQMNAVNFALQVIPGTTSATGMVYVPTHYYGLRKALPVLPTGASPANTTNKFTYSMSNDQIVSRCTNNSLLLLNGIDCRLLVNISAVTRTVCANILNTQRVYFDNINAPSTLFNIVASKLYGVIP